jgi:hypothetical protein
MLLLSSRHVFENVGEILMYDVVTNRFALRASRFALRSKQQQQPLFICIILRDITHIVLSFTSSRISFNDLENFYFSHFFYCSFLFAIYFRLGCIRLTSILSYLYFIFDTFVCRVFDFSALYNDYENLKRLL